MSAATPPSEDDKVLAGEYALGLLDLGEAAAFEARLVQDPALRALYAAWAEDFVALADDIPAEAPPAHVRAALETILFPAGAETRRAPFGWLVGGLIAAALAVVLIFNSGLLDPDGFGPDTPALSADIAAEDRSLIVAAAYDAGEGALYLERVAGTAAPGRALELWLIAGDTPPVSLGVLPADRQARLDVPDALRAVLDGAVLAISDEPPGGSPTGAPTGAVLAAGPVSKV